MRLGILLVRRLDNGTGRQREEGSGEKTRDEVRWGTMGYDVVRRGATRCDAVRLGAMRMDEVDDAHGAEGKWDHCFV